MHAILGPVISILLRSGAATIDKLRGCLQVPSGKRWERSDMMDGS